jgi:hypothetical protein
MIFSAEKYRSAGQVTVATSYPSMREGPDSVFSSGSNVLLCFRADMRHNSKNGFWPEEYPDCPESDTVPAEI